MKSAHAESARDFDIEQAEIVKTVKENERTSETSGEKRFSWNKFNGDLACRVVNSDLASKIGVNSARIGVWY